MMMMMNLKRILLGAVLVSAAIVLIGCPDTSLLDLLGGPTGPTPGNNGTISVDATGQTTIDISWTAATDDTTAAADIEYQVYYATSDQLSTPEDAAANGSAVFASWEAARESATLTELTPDTQYWMIVIARDVDPNMAAYTAVSASTAVGTVVDTEGPTPGGGGTILVGTVGQTTIGISWTAATDDTTADALIEYQVYYSIMDNIGTADAATANGTAVFAGWTAAMTTASVTGLTRDTSYWVNVVARDLAANITAYTSQGLATAMGPVIRLERDDTQTDITEGATIDYGTVDPWSGPVTKAFSIWNDGDQDLMLSPDIALRVVLSGDVGVGVLFEVTIAPALDAILPNNKETFAIRFTTDWSMSPYSATATIDSNDPSNAKFIFQLTAYASS